MTCSCTNYRLQLLFILHISNQSNAVLNVQNCLFFYFDLFSKFKYFRIRIRASNIVFFLFKCSEFILIDDTEKFCKKVYFYFWNLQQEQDKWNGICFFVTLFRSSFIKEFFPSSIIWKGSSIRYLIIYIDFPTLHD